MFPKDANYEENISGETKTKFFGLNNMNREKLPFVGFFVCRLIYICVDMISLSIGLRGHFPGKF